MQTFVHNAEAEKQIHKIIDSKILMPYMTVTKQLDTQANKS